MNVNPENRLLAKSLALAIRKSRTQNPILRHLLKLHLKAYGNKFTRNIAVRGFEMSFVPPGKEVVLSEKGRWKRDNRQSGKPGRVLRRVMKENLPNEVILDKDVEDAVNFVKALTLDGEFREVTGPDIGKWYRSKYEERSGSLNNSCMKGASSSQTALYDANPNIIKLVILLDKDSGRLKGRALLWDDMWMDRVYGNDSTIKLFHAYAKEKGYHYKTNSNTWMSPEGEDKRRQIWVDLKKASVGRTPYLDTFRNIDKAGKTISNGSGKKPGSLKSKSQVLSN